MKDRPKITRIEVHRFAFEVKDIGLEPTISLPFYEPGAVTTLGGRAIRIFTDVGVIGEYIGGSATEYSAIPMFVRSLIGRNALDREAIYNDAKQALRQHARMGMSQVDIALWDLAGKFYDAPIYELLGGYRTSLPCYASTYVGDSHPGGLDSPEAYADFAQQCLERWATPGSRYIPGRTPPSRSTWPPYTPSENGWGARWTSCWTPSAPSRPSGMP